MRYLPMILSAGLLLSVGLLAGSGPAHAAMPTLALDRSAVPGTAVEKVAYYHRPSYGYRYRRSVTVMGVAGATKIPIVLRG